MESSRKLAQSWPWKVRYKEYQRVMQDTATDWFRKKGCEVHPKMDYCLAQHSQWPENIIEQSVSHYIQNRAATASGNTTFPLHKYLHHGLSSQAMVFNLVGPMIVQNDLSPILAVLQRKGCKVPSSSYTGEFEYADRSVFNEDSGQPTSIDLVLKNESGTIEFFIESKFTEAEFGGCSVFTTGDCSGENPIGTDNTCYLSHIGRRYWEKMDKFGFSSHLNGQFICIFSSYYQFFREILFALEKGGTFVLLYDSRSPVFFTPQPNIVDRGIIPFLLKLVPPQHRSRFVTITMQEIVQEIESNHASSHSWITQFKEKYGIQ